jgi:hypothetical protein
VELEVPDLREVEVALRPSGRVTRGAAKPAEPRRGISLGEPVAVPITPAFAAGDAPLRAFVEAEADSSRYWLVHLACTFPTATNDEDPLHKAWLRVDLTSDSARPIAWSMTPMRLARATERSRTLKLGADAKLAQAGVEAGTTTEGSVVYLEALHLLESTPTWEFSRTDADEIRGSTLLAVVVRAPVAAVVRGAVELTAVVRGRRFGVVPFRAELPDRPSLSFRLAPG